MPYRTSYFVRGKTKVICDKQFPNRCSALILTVFVVQYTYFKPQNILINPQNILMISYTYRAKFCRTTPAYNILKSVNQCWNCPCREQRTLHWQCSETETSRAVTNLREIKQCPRCLNMVSRHGIGMIVCYN